MALLSGWTANVERYCPSSLKGTRAAKPESERNDKRKACRLKKYPDSADLVVRNPTTHWARRIEAGHYRDPGGGQAAGNSLPGRTSEDQNRWALLGDFSTKDRSGMDRSWNSTIESDCRAHFRTRAQVLRMLLNERGSFRG